MCFQIPPKMWLAEAAAGSIFCCYSYMNVYTCGMKPMSIPKAGVNHTLCSILFYKETPSDVKDHENALLSSFLVYKDETKIEKP